MNESRIHDVLDDLYAAYFEGDTDGMLATMSDDVEVRFLGRPPVSGIDAARRFFTGNNASLQDLDFRIRSRVVDGDHAAVVWDETATALGRPYENHGVDVFRIESGKITALRVNNDIAARRAAFGETPGAARTEESR